MEALKQILADAKAANALRVPVFIETLAADIQTHDDALGMLTAFRHAANSLALEAGVIPAHVAHDEAAKSVLQDVYFLEQLVEVELRFRTLSTGYERLRAAAFSSLELVEIGVDIGREHSGVDNAGELATLDELREALKNDLS